MLAAIIPADVNAPIRIEDIEPDLKVIQSLVGGYFQVVGIPSQPAVMYVDEEGKLKPGAEYNQRATKLAAGAILPHDIIVGDAVVLGMHDDQGNDTGLTRETADALKVACEPA